MPAFHFEGSSDSGFQVSGILEADDESLARRKAQRFCGTSEIVLVSEVGVRGSDSLTETAGEVGCDECFGQTEKGSGMRLVAWLAAALLGRGPSK